MIQNNYPNLPANLFFFEQNKEFLHKLLRIDFSGMINPICPHFLFENDQINSLVAACSLGLTPPSTNENNTLPFLNESNEEKKIVPSTEQIKELNKGETKKFFKVIYPEKLSLFTNINNNLELNEEEYKNKPKKNLLKNKKRPRKEYKDNIRRKIKRRFCNNYIINKLNFILKKIGSNLYFMRFPQSFVGNICIENNKKVINMTLLDIFLNKEINVNKSSNDFTNYYHNLNVINNIEIKENKQFQKILNTKYSELFNDFLNSAEFQIDEINWLKQKKFGDEFITRYINISKNFIKFFSE